MAGQPSAVIREHGRVGIQRHRVGIERRCVGIQRRRVSIQRRGVAVHPLRKRGEVGFDFADRSMDVAEFAPVAYQGLPQVAQQIAVSIYGLGDPIDAGRQGAEARSKVRELGGISSKRGVVLDELRKQVRVRRLRHSQTIALVDRKS